MKPNITWLLLLLASLCYCLTNQAQPVTVNRLFDKLKTAREDTDRVKIYYSISRLYWNDNPDSALLMGQKSLDLATRAQYEKGMALAFLTMGVAYGTKAMYPEALDCHLKALRLSEKLGLEGLMGNNYTNIAIIYSTMRDFPKAIDYFRRSLLIANKFPDQNGVAIAYLNIGDTYSQALEPDSAIFYTLKALHIAEKIHDSISLSASLSNLGDIYIKKKQPRDALDYLKRSLQISENIHDDNAVSDTHNFMADAYRQLGQYRRSIDYAGTSLQEARVLHTNETIKTSYHILYLDYLDVKDFRRALSFRNLEIDLNDSLYSLQKEKQIKMLQSDYELEKKQHQVDILLKDSLAQQAELQRGKIRLYLIIGGVILLIAWALFLIRGNSQKKRINRLLENHNREIVNRNVQLADLNEVKLKLLSIIGHDLRSPISTLKGFVDLLKNVELPPDRMRHFTAQMSESLNVTANLLDNLLFWAKTQMDGLQVNAQLFDLVPVLEQNRRLAADRAQKKKITLLTETAGKPVMAYADEVMIDMVIRNMVDNALKFSREGDTVHLLLAVVPEGVMVTVSDTGKGIPMEDQNKIFSSISYSTTGTSFEKGSGLGLSLCKEMIDRNNGKITFRSEPGKGTSFTFTLPQR